VLYLRASASGSNETHRFEQIGRTVGCIAHSRIIEASTVLQCRVGVEAEKIGRANGIVGARYRLVFIDQIRKDGLRLAERLAALKVEALGYLPAADGQLEFTLQPADWDSALSVRRPVSSTPFERT